MQVAAFQIYPCCISFIKSTTVMPAQRYKSRIYFHQTFLLIPSRSKLAFVPWHLQVETW